MSFGSFVKAVEADVEKVWHLLEGNPAIQEIEKIAIEAAESELLALAEKIVGVGTPLDQAAKDLLAQAAAKLISLMPAQPPVK